MNSYYYMYELQFHELFVPRRVHTNEVPLVPITLSLSYLFKSE